MMDATRPNLALAQNVKMQLSIAMRQIAASAWKPGVHHEFAFHYPNMRRGRRAQEKPKNAIDRNAMLQDHLINALVLLLQRCSNRRAGLTRRRHSFASGRTVGATSIFDDVNSRGLRE